MYSNLNFIFTYHITPTHTCACAVPQPPPSPKPQLLVLNATTVQLSWLPPFAWAEYPIVNYSVQVYNRATGEVMNSFINATSEVLSTTTPVTFDYGVPQGSVMQNCEELFFSVSAASIIGGSSPAVVTGGFPIGSVCVYTLVLFSFPVSMHAKICTLYPICFIFISM